jgi:hypothetical protein
LRDKSIGRIQVQGQTRQRVSETPCPRHLRRTKSKAGSGKNAETLPKKLLKQKRARSGLKVKYLPTKYKTLSSNPSTAKNKRKRRSKRKRRRRRERQG